jgi:hypothetical protein
VSGPAPSLTEVDGLYVVGWPLGRAATVELGSELFEALVEEANLGRRAVPVLQSIADALTRLVPSP